MPEPTALPHRNGKPASGRDRRAAVRYHSKRAISCAPVPEADEERWSARVQDVSSTGIGLVVDSYIEPETYLEVQIQDEDSDRPAGFVVRVVHAQEKGAGEWLLGCVFARALGDEEILALV